MNSLRDDIHGFEHVKRVYNVALYIGKKSNANLLILKIAALLHDIGRVQERKEPKPINHAELSAQKALKFLEDLEIDINVEDLKNIVHSIRAHSFSNGIAPETLEAQILSDADKLDALGAIGLYRMIGFTIKNQGDLSAVINHLEKKILNLKDRMHLEISKNIAEERHKIMFEFYKKIKKEL
ncbi:MAG: HD domain-containing protein [Promethearchaeota archaeon]|nr:MAG: HD domain-containing protein [Candidatus Lokiarchaeota archaeon]